MVEDSAQGTFMVNRRAFVAPEVLDQEQELLVLVQSRGQGADQRHAGCQVAQRDTQVQARIEGTNQLPCIGADQHDQQHDGQ